MDHNARIDSAIADLESQSRVNYAATAKKWVSNARRLQGAINVKRVTGTKEDTASDIHGQLTDVQEHLIAPV
jgi:hypothetical protein